MDSENVPHDQSAVPPSAILIPVDVAHIDQLVAIARDLAGIVLILDAAATGDPTIAAVSRFLTPVNDQLQEFKNWFHHAWRSGTASRDVK
jgi:transposase